MNRFRLALICLCVFAMAAPALAQMSPAAATASGEVDRPPELHIVTQELPNGLRLVMVEDHDAPVINLQVWYHVGSKDEKPGRTGFAHLFEHLMFKGSAHVAAEDHSRIIEAMGGFDNASTYTDMTVFWETFPSNYLERVLWLEADRMGSLNVDQDNFTSEREVVKEERRDRFDNVPYGHVIEDLYAAAFKVHPYQSHADRQYGRSRQGHAGRRTGILSHVLPPRQCYARDRGRFCRRSGRCMGATIFWRDT